MTFNGIKKVRSVTQAELKDLLDYDPETGVFVWRKRRKGVRVDCRAGSVDPNGYRYIRIDGEDFLAQRLAWFYVNGHWPDRILRFKDGDRDNCAIANLHHGFGLLGKYDAKTKEGRAAYQLEYRSKRRHIARERELMRSFGITQKQFEEMLAAQNEVCSICNKPEKRKAKNGSVRQLAVDHCHSTGEIRSLLCSDCNQMIGFSCDDPELLEKAAAYVRHHKKLPWSEPTLTEVPLGSMH